MNISANVLHALLLTVAIAAYVVLTVTGHDGNPVFIFIAGQGAGYAIQNVSTTPPTNTTVEVAPSRSTIQ
jgi:hypothetical protein